MSEDVQIAQISVLKARSNVAVMVISKSGQLSNQLRSTLKSIGFTKLTACSSHVAGIDRIKGRTYPLIVFEAQPTDMPTHDFVKQALELDPKSVLIAISNEPRIDDVFGLLRAGARGFVVSPFTIDALEMVIVRADEGPPMSDAILQAPDRNAALVAVVLNNLYRLTVLMRQSREFDSAKKDVGRYKCAFSESMELARMFCESGDEDVLRERVIEDCLSRANSASSRLGRTRQRLQKEREMSGLPN